ncbi:LysR family transcriptional regulator [Streptomyces sp. NBC_00316]|uniref:LysR family transcriptional regulator n=1 Tax=Streptomyces sp. NBC_00316 TaxID=2975710 RepID=UPI003FA7710E
MRVERARYLLAAVRTGSLRSAAAACGVSQPTIGQQLTTLEEELDVVLPGAGEVFVRRRPARHSSVRSPVSWQPKKPCVRRRWHPTGRIRVGCPSAVGR